MHASLWLALAAALLLSAAVAFAAYRLRRSPRSPAELPPAGPPVPRAEPAPACPEPPDASAGPEIPPAPPSEPLEPLGTPAPPFRPAPPAAEAEPATAEPRRADASGSVDAPASGIPAPGAPLVLRRELPLLALPRRLPGPTRYPVVLAHGFGGFDDVAVRGLRIAYFRGVAERLRASGVDVHVLRVSPLAPIAARARQLAAQIDRLGAERVNIVAHSMGGLDARYAIARLGMAARVASLTTIGTPHHGTPLADLGSSLIAGALGGVPAVLGAIRDLCPRQMASFNDEIDDDPGVAYGCIITAARRVNALLLPGYYFLQRRAGDNDGVVPASSQRWGAIWGELDVDHWGAVGWSSAFDAAAFYERLARDLGQRGF